MELSPLLPPTLTSATCAPLVMAPSAVQLSFLGRGHPVTLTLPPPLPQ